MSLSGGTKLGPYEILSPLGAGGMGEVYRARDTRLDREVAVKVLPARLTDNAEFKQRFEREARAISSLTHPNICALYDVGRQDGIEFLVMEYIEGETLAQRIARGPLPLADVLRIGAEVAAALDRAHRAGVVHRDLKPGNVMLTKGGAKLLDFGLAKTAAVLDSDPSAATVTQPLTSKGAIVGTFQYMAPEQLEGKEADARTDIFAFGAVLYEMATGRRAFEGGSRASLIASIMSANPRAISELQPMTPPALEHLVRMCLAKDPDDRIQTAHDVKLQLQWIAEDGSQTGALAPARARSPGGQRMPWVVATVTSLAALVALWFALTRPSAVEGPQIVAQLLPPEGLVYEYRAGPPALSPDGRMLALVLRTKEGETQIWVRDLDRATARRLQGTDGGTYPFWSPDSRFIGFFDGRHLKRIDVDGGPPDVVCDTPQSRGGGTWNRDGIIVFSAGRVRRPGGLLSVSASGGTPKRVTELDRSANEFAHRAPCFLPDGKHFLFSTRRGIGGENGVAIGSLDGTPPERILEVDSNAVFVEPGFVLYWRDGALRGQRFDPEALAVSGGPFVVASQARFEPDDTMALFTVSTTGILAFHPGQSATAKSQLLLRDRTGETVGTVGPPGNYYAPRFSHDGQFVAVDNSGIQNNGDIWVYGVKTLTAIRLTFDPADESRPLWSRDDGRIVYLSGKNGPDDLFSKELNNPVVEEVMVVDDDYLEPADWSPDGRYLAYNKAEQDSRMGGDIWMLAIEDGTTKPYVESPFTNTELRFSPDGQWVAYCSDETGRLEIYLQTFPEPTRKRKISIDGGIGPKWRKDGKELFYRALDDNIMAVEFTDGPGGEHGMPVALFKANSRFADSADDYDVSPDGQVFVVNTTIQDDTAVPMSLMINWMAGLDQE